MGGTSSTHMGENTEGGRSFGRFRRTRENNITIDQKYMLCKYVVWIKLAQDRIE